MEWTTGDAGSVTVPFRSTLRGDNPAAPECVLTLRAPMTYPEMAATLWPIVGAGEQLADDQVRELVFEGVLAQSGADIDTARREMESAAPGSEEAAHAAYLTDRVRQAFTAPTSRGGRQCRESRRQLAGAASGSSPDRPVLTQPTRLA